MLSRQTGMLPDTLGEFEIFVHPESVTISICMIGTNNMTMESIVWQFFFKWSTKGRVQLKIQVIFTFKKGGGATTNYFVIL